MFAVHRRIPDDCRRHEFFDRIIFYAGAGRRLLIKHFMFDDEDLVYTKNCRSSKISGRFFKNFIVSFFLQSFY